MRLSIDHRTVYRFTEPQARVVQLLRMTPRNSHDQNVAEWHIAVDRDVRLTEHVDGFGNMTTMLYTEGPVDRIEVTVTGEVVTTDAGGVLHGTWEPLPPRLFLRETALTMAGEQTAGLWSEARGEGEDLNSALRRLNLTIHGRFELDDGRSEPGLTAEDAAGRSTATARDLAHIFIAAVRARGIPARYVTGYCALGEGHRPTPHGWAEAWVDGLGWVGFDPALGRSPEDRHVRVAVALDAAGASPIAGSRFGEGDEQLEVDVSVSGDE